MKIIIIIVSRSELSVISIMDQAHDRNRLIKMYTNWTCSVTRMHVWMHTHAYKYRYVLFHFIWNEDIVENFLTLVSLVEINFPADFPGQRLYPVSGEIWTIHRRLCFWPVRPDYGVGIHLTTGLTTTNRQLSWTATHVKSVTFT